MEVQTTLQVWDLQINQDPKSQDFSKIRDQHNLLRREVRLQTVKVKWHQRFKVWVKVMLVNSKAKVKVKMITKKMIWRVKNQWMILLIFLHKMK